MCVAFVYTRVQHTCATHCRVQLLQCHVQFRWSMGACIHLQRAFQPIDILWQLQLHCLFGCCMSYLHCVSCPELHVHQNTICWLSKSAFSKVRNFIGQTMLSVFGEMPGLATTQPALQGFWVILDSTAACTGLV